MKFAFANMSCRKRMSFWECWMGAVTGFLLSVTIYIYTDIYIYTHIIVCIYIHIYILTILCIYFIYRFPQMGVPQNHGITYLDDESCSPKVEDPL